MDQRCLSHIVAVIQISHAQNRPVRDFLDEKLSQEDVNQKLLRSLSLEWNTHAVVWRNKAGAPRNQDNKNKESSRRSVHVETSTSTALVSCDGLGGYDWSDQQRKGLTICTYGLPHLHVQTQRKSSLLVLGYKTGLESVEEKLEFFKKNESVYVEKINGLKCDIQVGEITIRELKKKLEKIQKEKDSIQFNVDKFENASKSFNRLIECQIVNNCKKSLGYENYNAVPPPYTRNFIPATPNLSFTGLDEFVNKSVVKNSKAMSSEEKPKVVRKSDDALIIKDQVSDNKEEDVSQHKIEKKTVKTSIIKKELVKSKQQEKTARKTVKQVEHHRQNTYNPRGNQRNWKNMMSQKLGSNFEMFNKAYYVCGSFDHFQIDCNYHLKQFQNQRMVKPVWNNAQRGNLVRGLPSKLFENDQTCVACQKGKQHRASCKSKTKNSISLPLHLLHMDLFGPTFVKSLMKKMYCLVVTNDYSRFTWVFFLATKDETSGILKSFITGIENLVDHKVKVIRCDNGTEFKNREMNQFCEMKGILRQFSVARTPQQNGVAERRNRTLIEAARTMLADSKLPTTFWAEAVNTACYVQNKVLVVKPHNKTPYELFHGRTPTLSFMRPFGCPVTILNTIDHLGKFDGKADEGFFIGYSLNSKAFRVLNSRTKIVEENLHIRFSENTPNAISSGPDWLFDIDALTRKMIYEPIFAGTQSNGFANTKASNNAGQARKETKPVKDYILLPLWTADPPYFQ
ncbi:putative ribonuclease H-like domain-containing protein [Tanacetum coccineum]